MERIELRAIQETEDNNSTISVTTVRNGSPIFKETFSVEAKPHPLHTLSPDTIESTTDAVNSASPV